MADHLYIRYPEPSLYIAAATVLPALGTLLTIGRFIVRKQNAKGYGADDFLAIASLVMLWSTSVVLIIGWRDNILGTPTPPSPVPGMAGLAEAHGFIYLQKIMFIFAILSHLTFGFIKLSVICFYRRLFDVSKTRLHVFFIIAIVSIVIWTVAFFFAILFHCGTYISDVWNFLSSPHCSSGLHLYLAWAATDFATDLFIFFFPVPTIWRLNMQLKKKLAVTLILSLGAVSIAASAIRLSLHVAQYIGNYQNHYPDIMPNMAIIAYLCQVEAGLAVIAISLPILQKLISKHSAQSIIGSLRSVVSLGSIGSSSTSSFTRTRRNGSASTAAATVRTTRKDSFVSRTDAKEDKNVVTSVEVEIA